MIVYRALKEVEIANLIKDNNFYSSFPRGENTFEYEKDIDYRHFFYFYDSATNFLEMQNNDRYYNKYCLVAAYDIPDNILKEYIGFGKYYIINQTNNDDLLSLFKGKYLYYPEFAIPTNLLKDDYLIGIGNIKRITPVVDEYFYTLGEIVTKNQQCHLDYIKEMYNLYQNNLDNNILVKLEENKLCFFESQTQKIKK